MCNYYALKDWSKKSLEITAPQIELMMHMMGTVKGAERMVGSHSKEKYRSETHSLQSTKPREHHRRWELEVRNLFTEDSGVCFNS